MSKKLLLLPLILLLAFIAVNITTKKLSPITFPALPIVSKTVVLPLDSRPPCTQFVQELGNIAGTKVILPPKLLLDNYQRPAYRAFLLNWFKNNLNNADSAIISTDLLIHGGLLHSRVLLGAPIDEDFVLENLDLIKKQNPAKHFYLYSIIPRLLIADNTPPDSWWQWHLMRWSALTDIQDTFDDPVSFQELKEFIDIIPPELILKYKEIYRRNDDFNKKLLTFTKNDEPELLVIGQDDGEPFGFPNRNHVRANLYIKHENLEKTATTTRGADELGALLLAAAFNNKHGFQPKIFTEYSSPRVSFLHMPYMPCTVSETVHEKIQLLNGTITTNLDEADLILFVHCGEEQTDNLTQAAIRVKKLLATNKPLALVDLTANYDKTNLLFPQLINNDVPIVQLAAYAGWNTASNSIGTALAQSSIFAYQKTHLPAAALPKLYATNLTFNLHRFFDDWAYQKMLHANLAALLKIRGINSRLLSNDKQKVIKFISRELQAYKYNLLQTNLTKTPFYANQNTAYYLNDIELQINLPWDRIFEIELELAPSFVFKRTN